MVRWKTGLLLLALLTSLFALVSPAAGSATQAAAPTPSPTPLHPLPALTLDQAGGYFRLDGKPAFLMTRNLTGITDEDYDTLLDWAAAGGTRVLRLHLTHGWWGDPWINADWTVNAKWLANWDDFFDRARDKGIYVLPVFGVWADWNNGRPYFGSSAWRYNPLNTQNGGPLENPNDLFRPGSNEQKHWLSWVRTLVEHWQTRDNIAAWELFSELNIASGAQGFRDQNGGVGEAAGEQFTRAAVDVVHAADSQRRPVTLSLAGVYKPEDDWGRFYRLPALDFVQIHPYQDALDRQLIKEVREVRDRYLKPVMIGESGLWSLGYKPSARAGVRHAIWAGLVSGAMNGRALWDLDGYLLFTSKPRKETMASLQAYADIERPAADFAAGVDFTGFKPLPAEMSAGVWGAALGNEQAILGWVRDAACEPPNWDAKSVLTGQWVRLNLPSAGNAAWKVDFYDTASGTRIIQSRTVRAEGKFIRIELPDFKDDLAFKLHIQ